MQTDSLFTKIIRGDIPCHKIYEDDQTFAFLDIDPLLPGHVLVVPKQQIDYLDELPAEQYTALLMTVKKLSVHVRKTLGTARTVELVMGYDVPHAHVHLIPCQTAREFYDAVAGRTADRISPEPDHQALAKMAEKLAI